ncbi:MAG: BLUF domain-containing protein [Phycisphaeraceae bacterium]
MVLSHLLYISEACHPMNRTELEAIRSVSMRNNARLGITGVLFYSAGQFVQLLEGDMELIHTMFMTIAADARHENVKLLTLRPCERRVFAQWEMGLLDLDKQSKARQRDLVELVKLADSADDSVFGSQMEMEILSKFCMLLPIA